MSDINEQKTSEELLQAYLVRVNESNEQRGKVAVEYGFSKDQSQRMSQLQLFVPGHIRIGNYYLLKQGSLVRDREKEIIETAPDKLKQYQEAIDRNELVTARTMQLSRYYVFETESQATLLLSERAQLADTQMEFFWKESLLLGIINIQ